MSKKRSREDEDKCHGTHPKKECLESTKICATLQSQMEGSLSDFLSSINVYFLPAGFQKAHLALLKTQVHKFGGQVQENFNLSGDTISHVIVEDKMDLVRMNKLLKIDGVIEIPVVKSSWLSLCLKTKTLADVGDFRLKETNVENRNKCDSSPASSKIENPKANVNTGDLSDYSSSEDEQNGTQSRARQMPECPNTNAPEASKWICSQSSKNPKPNLNKFITDKLEEMVKAYESTNDKWRAFGYQKAIQSLRRHPKEISSWEEAKSLPGIGGRLADKIWEIAQSGGLRKLKEFQSSEKLQVLERFTNVWGAGPHTAQMWYQQGLRTIQDLQEKANLNHQQRIGVRLYDDLLERMPRNEATEIEQLVTSTAESIQPGIIAQICGSYRRGRPTCGDVDVLVTHPDGKSHRHVFHKLLAKLKKSGFLTDDLVSAEETGNQRKYMGVCKLPGPNRKHRRIDIIVVPYNEYGCALVYFTGSAHFNRSLRHLCKKQNMSLNEHALKQGVVRKGGEKIHEGTIIPTPTEESVFKVLNVPFRPPEERDH